MPPGAALRGDDQTLFTFKLQHSSDGKSRKIWGVASTEARDREKEIISETAITKALADFMALPIIHWYHTERPVGWVEKSQYGNVKEIVKAMGIDTSLENLPARGLVVKGEIKNTPDTDDVWNAIEKGLVDEWSICGTRRAGSPECDIPPHKRTSPCITKAMHLWSISLCPRGAGQNRTTFAEIVKAMTSSGSNLIHPTVDGVRRSIKKMDPEQTPAAPAAPPVEAEPAAQEQTDPLQEILALLAMIAEHLGVKAGGEDSEAGEELPPIPGPTANDEVIEKSACETPPGADLKDVKAEDDGDNIKKAADPSIVKAQADRIAQLEAELDSLKKITPQKKTLVIDPSITKAAKTPGAPPGDASLISRMNKVLLR